MRSQWSGCGGHYLGSPNYAQSACTLIHRPGGRALASLRDAPFPYPDAPGPTRKRPNPAGGD